MMFKTAIIDPPWPYERASASEKLKGYVSQENNKQYETLSVERLKELPVGSVVSSYIFLWTVGPFLKEGIELLEAWGFEYKTQLCWHKNTGLGVGYWFRGDHELVLLGKRKGQPSIRTNVRSIFASPRLRHSEKPQTIHEIVEKHFPGPYLEMFGRKEREGWTIVGNEAPRDGKDIFESLQSLKQEDVLVALGD